MSHLLVTNDFPPKIGGIQSYLWELWRRLPPGDAAVLTTAHPGDRAFDARQRFPVERVPTRVLLPTPALAHRVDRLARDMGAGLIVFDPVLPLGLIGRWLSSPYAVIVHGAETAVPGRLPLTRRLLGRVLRSAAHVVAAGEYVAAEAERAAGGPLPVTVVPPGVDVERFRPLTAVERDEARRELGLRVDAPLVVSVSRLVARKGMDVLIRAVAELAVRHPGLQLAIAGTGRDRRRLERVAGEVRAQVRFLGRVPDGTLPRLYGCADVFAMVCRDRWGGLEQEGFGIVFLEAAACGVPQVAGNSGGAAEAVGEGEGGVLVSRPTAVPEVVAALDRFLVDPALRAAQGMAARRRAVACFSYDLLADRLHRCLASLEGA